MSTTERNKRTVALAIGRADLRSAVSRGVIRKGREYGWRMLDVGCWRMSVPESIRIDGLIACVSGYDYIEEVMRLHRAAPVSVSLGATKGYSTSDTVARVERDYILTGERGAEHLLQRNFKNFAVAGYLEEAHENPVLIGFKERVEREGHSCCEFPPLGASGRDSFEHQGHFFRQLLRRLAFPLAIFCRNDRLASRVCYWCYEEGLLVPEQIAVLGVSNDPLSCECNPVPISSVDCGDEHRGVMGAELLEQMMNGEPAPKDPVLAPPGEVITRRSTDIIALDDLPTARSLRYIWDHYRKDIGVREVAEASGVPRRSISRHFKASMGNSIIQELNQTRLQKAARLLRSTEIPAEDISAHVGFRSAQYFSLRFKEHFGMAPKQYRQVKRNEETDGWKH